MPSMMMMMMMMIIHITIIIATPIQLPIEVLEN